MAPKDDNYDSYLKDKNISYIRRKQVQMENREGYENVLDSLKERIIEEEGAETRDEFRRDRTLWITNRIAQAKFPDNLDQYYTSKLSGPRPSLRPGTRPGTGTGTGPNRPGTGTGQGPDQRPGPVLILIAVQGQNQT